MNGRLVSRRAFLGTASLGAGAVWVPRWLAVGFGIGRTGQESASEEKEKIPPPDLVLRQALERARASGKPLLVFVVPSIKERAWERQATFGQYLNLCDDDALADLALCEVACARETDIGAVIPASDLSDEPLMALVETDGVEPVVSPLDLEFRLELQVIRWPTIGVDPKRAQEEFELLVRQRVDLVAGAVHGVVAGNSRALDRRIRQTLTTLGDPAVELVRRILERPTNSPAAEVDRVASLLRLAAEESSERRDACIAALANAASSRLRLQPPVGAWWANYTGCGHDIEGHSERLGYACGMARVPELGRRFLHFYSTECGR